MRIGQLGDCRYGASSEMDIERIAPAVPAVVKGRQSIRLIAIAGQLGFRTRALRLDIQKRGQKRGQIHLSQLWKSIDGV